MPSRLKPPRLSWFAALLLAVQALSAQESLHLLHSVLWMQIAEERAALCRQTYRAAEHALEAALRSPRWSAVIGQKGRYDQLPPAVILDVDETVLDNSPFHARLIRQRLTFTPELWRAWVGMEAARAVPGAAAYVRAARSRGIKVFFITNRTAVEEAATRGNLRRVGIPVDEREDVILSQGEREGWGADKTSRRMAVAHRYRVLQLLGDDLGDFLSVQGLSPDERAAAAEPYSSYWGTRWIMLPNPIYGSWERSMPGLRQGLSPEEVLRLKLEALDTVGLPAELDKKTGH